MTIPIKVFIIVLIGVSITAQGQSPILTKISTNDSVKIQTMVVKFYSWYADLINRKKVNKEFNPSFIKDQNGMTTLDFTNYATGLRKHDFSDDFIVRSINNYQPCLNNLKTISYDTFLGFEDRDRFDSIKCDFANLYEWTKSMNPLDGAELVTLNKVDKRTMESTVRFYNSTSDGVKHYWGSAALTIKQYKTGWMIDDLR